MENFDLSIGSGGSPTTWREAERRSVEWIETVQNRLTVNAFRNIIGWNPLPKLEKPLPRAFMELFI